MSILFCREEREISLFLFTLICTLPGTDTESRLTQIAEEQIAEEAVAPERAQAAPTATQTVQTPTITEAVSQITSENKNARNEEITAPAETQAQAVNSANRKVWNAIAEDLGKNGREEFLKLYAEDLPAGSLDAVGKDFITFYNAGKRGENVGNMPIESRISALEAFDGDIDALTASEKAAYIAGAEDAGLMMAKENSLVEDRAVDDGVIDLSNDTELAKRVEGKHGSERYNAIRDYILDELSGIDVVLSDGNNAVVDRKDAQHIAHKAGDKKTRAISEIKRLVERAKLIATENSVDNNKFRNFRYYEASVRYHDKTFPVYVNVGIAKNDGSYHIYDITHKLRATAHRLNDVGRVNQTYALEAVPLTKDSIPDNPEKVNTVSKKTERLDVKRETGLKDDRFYAPREIENAKEKFEVAQQRITNANKQQVIQARADIVIFAHNRNAAEELGISQAELNKKLRSWTKYSASAREISERINAGVPLENRWTGIENCAWVNQASVSQKDIDMLVKSVTGDPNGVERKYIARTMLALDTHIDYRGLNFIFESKAELNKKHGFSGRTNGIYNGVDIIVCKYMAPNTVAHEMGHYLDMRFGRDLEGAREDSNVWLTRSVNKDAVRERYGEDGVKFVDNFDAFVDGLANVGDAQSGYSGDRAEVFARFVARFVEWTENVAAGYRMSNYEYNSYNDRFTTAQYVEFARLLQEKALLDEMRAKEAVAADKTTRVLVDGNSEKYDIGVLENGNTYVIASRNVITASDVPTMRRQITNFFQTLIGADNGTEIPTIEGDVLTITKAQTGNKARDNYIEVNGKRIRMLDNEFAVKVRAEAHIDELAETSGKRNAKTDEKKHSFARDGFVYRTAFFQDFDGKYYKITLSVGKNGETATVYNIGKIKEDKLPSAKLIAVVGSKPLGNMSSASYDTPLFTKSQEGIEKYFHDDEPDAVADAYADLRKQLAEANRKLAEVEGQRDRARAQLKRTEQPTVRSDDARKIAREFIKRYGSDANVDGISKALEDLGNLIVRGGDEKGDATFTRVSEKAADIMYGIISASDSVYDPDEVALHKEIRDSIRSTPLYISRFEKAEIYACNCVAERVEYTQTEVAI